MSERPFVQTASEHWGHTVPALALVTERHRAALDQLHQAANHRRTLAVLIADGKFEANHVLGSFLSAVDDDASVVRLTKPYNDAMAGMREITRAIGFDPKDLSIADLDNIFGMFLKFQRDHHRRTYLCIEQADQQARWLLDHIRQLIEVEEEGRFGLMVILSGQPQLKKALDHEPLSIVRAKAGRMIRLEPFTLSETTEFLRCRVEATSTCDISQLFEFDAINRIHMLSGGVPDLVGTLCFKSLQIANQLGPGPVTERVVEDAARLLWQKPDADIADRAARQPNVESLVTYREKLAISYAGKPLGEFALRRGRFLIGRAQFADLCLTSKNVSRRHALLIRTDTEVTIRDLGSTTGTFVNGLRFSGPQRLEVGDVITIADCRLEYRLD